MFFAGKFEVLKVPGNNGVIASTFLPDFWHLIIFQSGACWGGIKTWKRSSNAPNICHKSWKSFIHHFGSMHLYYKPIFLLILDLPQIRFYLQWLYIYFLFRLECSLMSMFIPMMIYIKSNKLSSVQLLLTVRFHNQDRNEPHFSKWCREKVDLNLTFCCFHLHKKICSALFFRTILSYVLKIHIFKD